MPLNIKSVGVKPLGMLRKLGLCAITFGLLSLSGCAGIGLNKYGVKTSERVYTDKGKLPKKAGYYKVGKPYKVAGKWYYPREDTSYNKTGKASWYGDEFHGRKTANSEIFDMHAFTAAHKTLPLPSLVKVTNLANNKSIIVRVNDRGPYHNNRLIDLSRAAAEALGYKNKGLADVRVEYFGKAAAHPDGDNAKIAALGGKTNGGTSVASTASNSNSNPDRNFIDWIFGWNQPKFVADNAVLGSNSVDAVAKGSLNSGDMAEFDTDIASAITPSGSVALSGAGTLSKNQGRLLSLDSNLPLATIGGEFIQVAMFKDIKQAIEYKKQLGDSVFSKIDIRTQNSNTLYLVMVQA
ncbi:MAG: septal ring lytic transglycosylase RlpA family protein [Rhizobiales bacterium]|nr:septal ring lytic transglycosylase RlpA family protein [Hyphomicrobiales bacterium]